MKLTILFEDDIGTLIKQSAKTVGAGLSSGLSRTHAQHLASPVAPDEPYVTALDATAPDTTATDKPWHGTTIYSRGHRETCRCSRHHQTRTMDEPCYDCQERAMTEGTKGKLGKYALAAALAAGVGAYPAYRVGRYAYNQATAPTLINNGQFISPSGQNTQYRTWQDLTKLAEELGFEVTSTTGGKHNVGSAHYDGRAIDVRSRGKTEQQIEKLVRTAGERGIWVKDERRHPVGQEVWGGPHIHLEVRLGTR